MKNKLCLTNLLEFFEDLNSEVDDGDHVDVAYLDSRRHWTRVLDPRVWAQNIGLDRGLVV